MTSSMGEDDRKTEGRTKQINCKKYLDLSGTLTMNLEPRAPPSGNSTNSICCKYFKKKVYDFYLLTNTIIEACWRNGSA